MDDKTPLPLPPTAVDAPAVDAPAVDAPAVDAPAIDTAAAEAPAAPAPHWLQGLRVLVLGLGESGLAMARWCLRHGAAVTVWDSRESPPGAAALLAAWPGVPCERGELTAERVAALLEGCQLVLKSPGLAPADERVAPLLAEASAIGIAVMGELDLFARALAELKAERGYAPRLLAITGTNGKTTTTAMTALLVARAGRRVAVAGNIGPTLLDVLAAALEAEAAAVAEAEAIDAAAALEPAGDPAASTSAPLPEVWVLELSSFQLQGGGRGLARAAWGFEPDAGVLLNLTQDHLDWHGSMAAYGAAKAQVWGARGLCVVNRDDPAVEALLPRPELHEKGPQKGKPKSPERAVLRFGLSAPTAPGDFGLVVENGMAWLVRALPLEEGLKLKKGEQPEIHLQRLMPADALRVRGRHNAANALAALALATAIGCPLAPMLHGLREYAGEPHRAQFVARVPVDGGEVDCYDDSKGTNVGATVAALNGLGADLAPGRLVVILGGDGKGQDFAPLAAPLAQHARAVATIGRDAAAVEAALAAAAGHSTAEGAAGVAALRSLPLQRFVSLELAVNWGLAQARPGDALLLSPACASLDMFRNYAHRAEVFVAAVQALAAERGAFA